MSVMVVFLAVVAGIAGWWLSRQRLGALPWLETGVGEVPRAPPDSGKLGLGLFITVATCLFALLFSAYLMRTEAAPPDLGAGVRLLPPGLLWVNTAILLAAGAALQLAAAAARQGRASIVLAHIVAAALATLAFVAGQLLAWRLLTEGGHSIASSPANAFFYTLTGAHALHVLGGLVALGGVLARLLRGATLTAVGPAVQLCVWYWHFLLLVWLAVFGLLAGGAATLSSLCRALVS